ncbi:MAG: HNH endonuclease [Acidobacteriota bacterium]|nr:HNH endonuclease [Acidobacteriota bacterium]
MPEHVKRAVRARDGNRCRNCKVETEFLHFDHIVPFDLGGPTTADNIQRLCPTCNTSKGNQTTCRQCGHWMSPDKSHCTQCGARLAYTKHSETLAGKAEALFQKVGRAVVLGGAAVLLLALLAGGLYVYSYFRGAGSASAADQAASVSTVVNSVFDAPGAQPALFKVVVPPDASNARVVGGYKVTSGPGVNFYIFDSGQYEQWSRGAGAAGALARRERSTSVRLRQVLSPGTYYLLFAGGDGAAGATKVAAEFYLKYD